MYDNKIESILHFRDTKLRKITIGYAVLERGPETLLFPVVGFKHFELPFVGQIKVEETGSSDFSVSK